LTKFLHPAIIKETCKSHKNTIYMETKDFYVPSLTVVLDEQNFFLSKRSLSVIKRLDEPILNIFHILHNKRKIFRIEYESLKRNYFLIICKIFFSKTKYFKLVFVFSLKGDFSGVFLDSQKLEISDDFSNFQVGLKWLLLRKIHEVSYGIYLENDYNDFLKIFEMKNFCCLGFENTANDEDFDPLGIDFRIKFRYGLMPLQVKGSGSGVERHEKLHPGIPCVVSYVGEAYEKREITLLNLADKYFA